MMLRCIQSITGGKGRQRAGGGLGIFEKRPQNALTHLKYSQYTSPPESVESSSSSSCSQWCIKQQERRRKSRPTANSPLHFESGKRRRRRIFQQTYYQPLLRGENNAPSRSRTGCVGRRIYSTVLPHTKASICASQHLMKIRI